MKERVRRLIEISRYSEREFAMKADINPSTLNLALDPSRGEPSIDVVLKILNSYNISADWLLLGIGNISTDKRALAGEMQAKANESKPQPSIYIEDRIAEIEKRLLVLEKENSIPKEHLVSFTEMETRNKSIGIKSKKH